MLTAKAIAAMAAGEWLADPAARGAGRLQVRRLANGSTSFYYRYTGPDGARVRLPLGTGLTLAAARDIAAGLSRRYQAGDRDLRGAIEIEVRAAARAIQDEVRARAEAGTLGDLMTAYVDSLAAAGKESAGKVRNSVDLHIRKPWSALWGSPARELTLDDLLPVVARLVMAGKPREADKVRSYLRAAYAAAIAARQSPQASESLRALGITGNPARDLMAISGATVPGERALSMSELRAYWRRIQAIGGADGALLRLHLLTGGQRVAQLSRVTLPDWDMDSETIMILDGKGRRHRPRRHYVPLIDAASAALLELRGRGVGAFLFTADQGATSVDYSGLRRRLVAVAETMQAAGELPGGGFTPGDIRRTVETRLAAAGSSSDARAHLQSHGLGGVQSRHYDRHEYADEKRGALESLYRLLTDQPSNV